MTFKNKLTNRNTSKAKTSKEQVRNMIRGYLTAHSELKGTVFTNANTTMSAAGGFQFITQGVIQGDAINQRNGSQINLVSLRIKVNTFAVGVTGVARYVLYQDTQANGATPLVTDILDSAASVSVLNQLTVVTQKRYHIIDDFTHSVPINGPAVKLHDRTYGRDLIKPVTYLGNTSATASNGRNSVYLLYIGTATNVWDYSFHVKYTDI